MEEVKKEKEKAKNSEKAFQIWKETKDSELEKKIQKFKETMKEKDSKKTKKEESGKAFILW